MIFSQGRTEVVQFNFLQFESRISGDKGKNKMSFSNGKKRSEGPAQDNPPQNTEVSRALSGLHHSNPEIRRSSAEILSHHPSIVVLNALKAANAVESIVTCKAEIIRAIHTMEQFIEVEPGAA